MTGFRALSLLLFVLLCTLTGCAAATLQSSPLPDGFAIRPLAKVDTGTRFALNRTGSIAVQSEGTTRIIDLSGGLPRSIAPAPATSLSFSPKGDRLAAAFATPAKTLLRLFDLQGKLLAETVIPGRVGSIAWRSEKEILATALVLKKFSFGCELIASLYRWDGVAPPVATLLSDMTARPKLARLPDAVLFGSFSLALSPYGDEIAYSILKDPPLFTPYLKVAVRHLDSGAERDLAEVGIGSGELIYMPDGESLVAGDAKALTRRVSVPEAKELNAWATPGDSLAISPSGSYLLLDGRLFQGDREIAWFPSDSIGAFLPDGSGLAISQGGTLFLVSGLKDSQPPGLPKDLERVLELRRLRMLGLITDKEFKARKTKAPSL